MKKWGFWISLLLLSSICLAQESEDIPQLDRHAVLVVCAAAHIVAENPADAAWFATIVEDAEQINFFTNLFIVGLETKEISAIDLARAIEACNIIRANADTTE